MTPGLRAPAKRRTWTRFATVMLLGLSLLLAACSGAGKGKEPKNQLEAIKARGYITVATSGNNPPTNFYNDKNELVGLDIDWANIIAEELGVRVEWKILEFKGILPGVLAGQFDLAMAGVNVTDERKETFDFSDHYAYTQPVAIIAESRTDINSPHDVTGKVLGVVNGSSDGEAPMRAIGGFSDIKLYPGQAEMFADLKNERIDMAVTGNIMAGYWTQTEGKGFKLSAEGLDGRYIAVAMKQNEPELKDAINAAIKKAKDAGKYEELAVKWLGVPFAK